MSRTHGGVNTTEVRVSSNRVSALLNRIDILMPIGLSVIPRLGKRISEDTIILGDGEVLREDLKGYEDRFIDVPLADTASRMDGSIYSNTVAVGVIAGLLETKEMLKKTITYTGYALVDIFQPCVTYNRVNTYRWFKEHTYYLEDSHDPTDRIEAFKRAIETDKLLLGIFYVDRKPTFEESLSLYKESLEPLYRRDVKINKVKELIESMRG